MNCLKLIPVYIVYIVSLVISEAQMPPLEQPEKRREERNREKRRRKAIEARLSSSGFNSRRPFPCFPDIPPGDPFQVFRVSFAGMHSYALSS